MIRLFVAIALPEHVTSQLARLQGGVPGARWTETEKMHLTVRFIGEVDGRDADAIDDALASIRAPAFTLELMGVGSFGGKSPRALWAGVRDNPALIHLQRKVESALQRVGVPDETRKFTPHVTLARLNGAPKGKIMDFLADHALFASGPFPVARFTLFSSELRPGGSLYRAEREYPLES